MVADNALKNILNFDFRETFYKQTAIGMLSEDVVVQNINRLNRVKEQFTNTPYDNRTDIDNVLNRLRKYYESKRNVDSVNFGIKELCLISYHIPQSDFKFCKYILQILRNKWYASYTSGLIHSLLRNWYLFDPDIRLLLKEELSHSIKTSRYADIEQYLSDNGAYQLGYRLYKENKSVYDCCKSFNLAANRISYSYFTGVLKGYYEMAQTVNYEKLRQALRQHNNTLADKVIISRLIVRQYDNSNVAHQLFDLAIERIGDPYIESSWAIPNMATREESEIIKKAQKAMVQIISSKVINVFFSTLCCDTSRLNFWLRLTSLIEDFKVYGPAYLKNDILSKLDDSIVKAKFCEINGKGENCALVMYVKNYVIVEFSGSGALYIYNKGSDYHNMSLGRKIEKIDDLKQPYMPQLIYNSYDYMSMNAEGRMVHSGNWQYRLDMWFKRQIGK